jgi:hypothetical protein
MQMSGTQPSVWMPGSFAATATATVVTSQRIRNGFMRSKIDAIEAQHQ